jgi:hypothetical protein
MRGEILAPAAVLVLWTLVMLGWVGFSRVKAIGGSKTLIKAPAGIRGQDLDKLLPATANWPSHNYTHLTEQPTLFYATVTILALMGAGGIDVALAWAYVVLRVVHSFWQSLVNRIPVRFTLFALQTLCLLVLAVRAAIATF